MNTIINAKLNVFVPPALRGRDERPAKLPNEWNQIKKRWHGIIDRLATEQEFECPPCGYFNFMMIEPNKRRNKDNAGSGASKVIFDALVKRGSLYNDGWKEILDYRHFFDVDEHKPGVYLIVTEHRLLNDEEGKRFLLSLKVQTSMLDLEPT
jgi:hypothetical protein